jgi:KUP system potassium uptake protein
MATEAVDVISSSVVPAKAGAGRVPRLALGALGVVYGDIGTSPLYAIRECFSGAHSTTVEPAHVLGVLSLVAWSLILVVVVKYLVFAMRADNRGEGGILALLALLVPEGTGQKRTRARAALMLLGLFGAALLFADGMITPAISVISAVEGLELATPVLHRWIVPIAMAILVGLFMVQRHGTGKIARFFGPTMLVWFVAIALMGLPWVVRRPEVVLALNPLMAVRLAVEQPHQTFLLLGSVVLCITGAEALYADMGHFGPAPIRVAWFAVVFPALLVNYFGQGARLLADPGVAGGNLFYSLAPEWLLYPSITVATVATIIASQALISGAFSLAQQAVQLGYSPRLRVVHTSRMIEGQIYIPEVNFLVMLASLGLVVGFRSSSNLAAAYGVAVMGTMVITSVLLFAVAWRQWGWSWWQAWGLLALFLAVEVPFLLSNLTKFYSGGWFPLFVAGAVFTGMTTWFRGRYLMAQPEISASLPLNLFVPDIQRTKPLRVEGTAVFMSSRPEVVPTVLMHHYKHNRMLHERVILLHVATLPVPTVPPEERVRVRDLDHGFYQVTAYYGFMEQPNVSEIFLRCRGKGLNVEPGQASYFLGRSSLLPTGRSRMMGWRKRLFAFLYKNERAATDFFDLPPNRVVEMGRQVEL